MSDRLAAVVGKEAPVQENEAGGRQSSSPYLLRALPPLALLAVGRVLKDGARSHEDDPFGNMTHRNWHKISSDEHIEHALTHIVADMQGDLSEGPSGHLAHAATRILFALHMRFVENPELIP